MGVWMDLFVSPAEGMLLSPEKFMSLVSGLISQNFVDTPCAICEGEFEISTPLGISNSLMFNKLANKNINIHYKGEDFHEMLKKLEVFPFRKANLCIWFSKFNWKNEALSNNFEKLGYANTDILLFAFASPQKAIILNAYDGSFQESIFSDLFVTTGKGGLESINRTIIESTLD
ncbi:MAG: hypothetical protein IPL71_09565 [Anaerolineales bacterium]|uniref:hypothetical protein n=1 Tax=Candidatus Villigracilis proximus TaxID=3140683 RepID=UPI0031368B54|nr:hypothetical protein [Anaerolineales bacterium]